MRKTLRLEVALFVVALGGALLTACCNSILGNAAEAGLETVLDEPLPTPTAPVRDQSGAVQPR